MTLANMIDRINQIVKYKAGGKKMAFGTALGWSNQYTSNLLRGAGNIGLQPIIAIVSKYPDINARWLLTGEGEMLNQNKDAIRRLITADYDKRIELLKSSLSNILKYNAYISVMSDDEIETYINGGSFSDTAVADWEAALTAKQTAIDAAFNKAYKEALK